MGQLVDGVWQKDWYKPDDKGAFVRPKTRFRSRIGADGPFATEAGRYHIYASYACPWAHRALITRAVRGLAGAVSVTIVDPKMTDEGWSFDADDPDPIHGAKLLREIYLKADSKYSGRVTVPVLWDKRTGTIVNNESREVMRMLDTELFAFASGPCLAPAELVPAIDAVLDDIYTPINNGVYRAGFATKQDAYEQACTELFEALDRYDAIF